MDIHSLLLFVIAALSINLIPGPDVIYIVSNTLKGKMRAGVEASLGLGVGYLVHTVASVFGLSALIVSSAFLFSVIKYAGAFYLFYLGLSALINCYRGRTQLSVESTNAQTTHIFKQGVIISVLNPKVALFFLAFLPQFIDPSDANVSMHLCILGLLFSVLATCCNLLYASLGNVLFNRPHAQKYATILEGLSGILLVGLSAKILLNTQDAS